LDVGITASVGLAGGLFGDPQQGGSLGWEPTDGANPVGNNPAYQGVRRGMKIFHLSWWVLPMVSVGTVAVIAAVLGCIVVLLRL
jgi:hypothetical protein